MLSVVSREKSQHARLVMIGAILGTSANMRAVDQMDQSGPSKVDCDGGDVESRPEEQALVESTLEDSELALPRRTGYSVPSTSLDDITLRCIPPEYVAGYDQRTGALLDVVRYGAAMPLVLDRVLVSVRCLALVAGIISACNNGYHVLLPGVDGITWQATADDATLGFGEAVSSGLLHAAKQLLSNLKSRALGFQYIADALNRQDLANIEELVGLLSRGQTGNRSSEDVDWNTGLEIFDRVSEYTHMSLPYQGDTANSNSDVVGSEGQVIPGDYQVAMTPAVQEAFEKQVAFNQTVQHLKPTAPSFAAVHLLYGCDKAYHNELISQDRNLLELAAAIPALANAHDVFDRLALEVISGLGSQRILRERSTHSDQSHPRPVSPEAMQRYWYTCVLSNLGASLYEKYAPVVANAGAGIMSANRYINSLCTSEALKKWICPREKQPQLDYHVLRAFATAKELKKHRTAWYKFKAGYNNAYPTRDYFGTASDQASAAVAMLANPSRYVVNVSKDSEPKWILWQDHQHYTTQDTYEPVVIKQKTAHDQNEDEWSRYLEETLPLAQSVRSHTATKPARVRVI